MVIFDPPTNVNFWGEVKHHLCTLSYKEIDNKILALNEEAHSKNFDLGKVREN